MTNWINVCIQIQLEKKAISLLLSKKKDKG